MNRIVHSIRRTAVFLLALLAASCVEPLPEHSYAELMVSLYIPDVLTKGETGPVDPTAAEKKITSLQIWVFISNPNQDETFAADGTFISYKAFNVVDPDSTGLGHSSITRYALPLNPAGLAALSVPGVRVDVYAVANGVETAAYDKNTPRGTLDAVVLTGDNYGVSASGGLTTAVPSTGLPMSGVLKGEPVKGGYPVFNIPALTLTRAVSKLRFVFVQQGRQDNTTSTLVPLNDNCVIESIVFDGTDNGADCQIAAEEYLFKQTASGIKSYMPFAPTISGDDPSTTETVEPLISAAMMACSDDPASLAFRSAGNEGESAQAYEARLDDAIAAKATTTQVGPIYLRETDKPLSGTIYYRTNQTEPSPRTVRFTIGDDQLTRNHSWIVYAYFAEETRTLKLSVVVVDWVKEQKVIDYTTGSVNVVRRFTAAETDPATFKKVQTDDGFFDVSFWHTVNGQENVIHADIIIATPVGGVLNVVPVPGRRGYNELGQTINIEGCLSDAIIVTPMTAGIYPAGTSTDGTVENCKIEFEIKRNKSKNYTDAQLEGQYIDLHFFVQYAGREIDLGSESIDYYRFILEKNWQ